VSKSIKANLNSKNTKTLVFIFSDPVRSDIKWADIECLLDSCGAEISEGRGSRIRVALNRVRATFHRPHPKPETDKGAVKDVRKFLSAAGISPTGY